MSPEVAMEQYISLLSDKDPGWREGQTSVSILTDKKTCRFFSRSCHGEAGHAIIMFLTFALFHISQVDQPDLHEFANPGTPESLNKQI